MSKIDKSTPEKYKQRALKQSELRLQLSERCRITHIIDNIEKIEDVNGALNPANALMEKPEFDRLKSANDQRIKLLGKYLPDLKAMELSQSLDNPLFESSNESIERRLRQLSESAGKREAGSSTTH